MKPLLTPAQVAAMAFRAPDFINPEAIPPSTIISAQHLFILPVVGRNLYSKLCESAGEGAVEGAGEGVDAYAELFADRLAEPLALYVKAMMMPLLAVQTGTAGVVQAHGTNLARASETRIEAAVDRIISDARVLMIRATEHIEARAADYPEYDPADNVLRRCSVAGGIIMT